jgi:hypothetical protein
VFFYIYYLFSLNLPSSCFNLINYRFDLILFYFILQFLRRCLNKFLADGRIVTLTVTATATSAPDGSGAYLAAEVEFIDGLGQRNLIRFSVRPGT